MRLPTSHDLMQLTKRKKLPRQGRLCAHGLRSYECADCLRPKNRPRPRPRRGTADGVILEAAGQLRAPFTAAQLVVRAWQLAPEVFGLDGCHDKHPDSNRVLSYLYGDRGLIGRGFVRNLGDKTFEVA